MTILNAGEVAGKLPSPLFHVALREPLGDPYIPKSFPNVHSMVLSERGSTSKGSVCWSMSLQFQAGVRGNAQSLKINLQGSIEGELKGLVLFLTHRVLTSGAPSAR